MTGANTLQRTKQTQEDIIKLLHKGGFELHKWCANNTELLDKIPKNRREFEVNESDNTVKTLGLLYQPDADIFKFKIQLDDNNRRVTKRTILSDIARVFDPLGFLGPVITSAKILMQELWKLILEWDETVPINCHTKWTQYRNQLLKLNDLKINRWMLPFNSFKVELHGFCDASQLAFGACIYLKGYDESGSCAINLVCSKARVAPVRTITIPRLELCGAVLLSELFEKVKSALNIQLDKCFFWTDSTIVLAWLRSSSSQFKTFIANRVSTIQQHTNINDW